MSSAGSPRGERSWWRPRWYEAVPELVLAAGLTVFLVDEPDAATSAFKSDRAVALMIAAGLLWIVSRIALARLVRWPVGRTVLFALAAVSVLAVVVAPAYRDETVVEAFPISALDGADQSPTTIAAATTKPNATTPTTASRPEPAAPVLLRSGAFIGIDHRASGTVSIYRAPDGRYVLGLEDFDIQPGPDYDVYVVPGTDRADHDGGARLDDLRGNQGTQFYDVPAEVDVETGAWTVLIWCQTFGVPVAHATPL